MLARAADLFAERGYNGTSLQDIADTMGMTRPAIVSAMCNSIAWWLKPDGAITPRAVAELVAELTLRSLKRPRRRTA